MDFKEWIVLNSHWLCNILILKKIKKMYTELTLKQKLQALSLKYYDWLQWIPKKGDYYTTSRNDLELYQIVDEDNDFFYTNYCDKKTDKPQDWIKQKFLQEFGERRVYVPDFILENND